MTTHEPGISLLTMRRGDGLRRSGRHIRRLVAYELQLAATAWRHSTRVPLPLFINRHTRGHSLEESIRYLPLVGIFVGAICGAVFLGAHELFENKALAVLLSMAAGVLVTHASAGTLNTLTILVALLIQFHSLLLVPDDLVPSILIAAQAFTRLATGTFLLRPPMATQDLVIMSIVGVIPLILVDSLSFLLLVPLLWLMRSMFGLWLGRRQGDHTSESLISVQRLVEAAFYLLVVLAYAHPISID